MQRPDPAISIVIVNWNTVQLLEQCLRSIIAGNCDSVAQIIVVDNGSTDTSLTLLQEQYPHVHCIQNRENVGFGRATNQGLSISTARYVLLLNSDTIIPPHAFAQLVDFMDHHSDAGACSPRLCQLDGQAQPFAFGDDPTPWYLARRATSLLLFRRPLHDWSVSHTLAVDWVSAACMLVRRSVIEQIGGLDEQIFMYFEDNDWCLRMRKQGWKIYYVPDVAITHIGGQSSSLSLTTRRHYDTSLQYFYRKHYGTLSQRWLQLFQYLYRSLQL
jgi:N-acetylglucosaminyl-diphospho-decaprenol L-rhamnosyltransferase